MPRATRRNANNNNNNENDNNNYRQEVVTQERSPQWRTANMQPNGPALGEVRFHKKTGLMYIYQIHKERVGWWRYDTWVWRVLDKFPRRRAMARELRKFNRRALGLAGTDRRPTFVQVGFK